MLVCAALSALDALASMVALKHLIAASPAFINAVGESRATVVSDVRSTFMYDVVVGLAAALVLAASGVAVRRQSQSTRIAAWCVAVALVIALGCGVAAGPEGLVSPTGNETLEVRSALGNLIVGWYTAVHRVIVVAEFAGMIAVMLLLLR